MNNKEKAVEYVKNTLKNHSLGECKRGKNVQEIIDNADYDIQNEVKNIFAFLMPVPNNGVIYMSEQIAPLGNGMQLMLQKSIDEICIKLDEY